MTNTSRPGGHCPLAHSRAQFPFDESAFSLDRHLDRAAKSLKGLNPPTTNLTRLQLLGGLVAMPLFFQIALGLASTRERFDLRRHFLSQLSAGDLGWIQMANFSLWVGCICCVPSASGESWRQAELRAGDRG
jgi:hypothetical protein